jgi:hypothetical protein
MSDHAQNGWIKTSIRELEHAGDIVLGRGKIISQKDIEADPGDYPVYSSSAKGNGEFGRYGKFMFDEELVTWSVDGGGKFFYRPKSRYSITNVSGFLRVTAKEKPPTPRAEEDRAHPFDGAAGDRSAGADHSDHHRAEKSPHAQALHRRPPQRTPKTNRNRPRPESWEVVNI